MTIMLGSDLSFSVVENRCYFINLRTGRYFVLSDRLDRAFQGVVRAPESADLGSPEIQRLIDRGIICADHGQGRALAPCSVASILTDMFSTVEPGPWGMPVIRLLLSQIILTLALRVLPTGMILSWWQSRALACGRQAPSSAVAMVPLIQAQRRADLMWTPDQRCLVRALALCTELARRGHRPTLVFGISPVPFTAHSWVQIEETLCNDSIDVVQAYTPILAL